MKWIGLVALAACAGCYMPAYYEEETVAPPRRGEAGDPLTLAETEKLLKAGVSDGIIVEKAKKSGAVKLSADDIVVLKQVGASDVLVRELILAERRPVEPRVATTRTTYTHYYGWSAPSIYVGYSYWPRYRYYHGCGW
jgi:hypothetical protein